MRRTASQKSKTTSIRVNTKLVDEAVRALGSKSRAEGVRIVLEEFVSLNSSKNS